MADALRGLLARHDAFWRCEAVDAPLAGTSRWSQLSLVQLDWGLPEPEGLLEPGMLRVEHLLPQYEALFQEGGPFDGDLCWPAMPPTAIPWLEGILGCPIRYSLVEGSIFAEPILGDGSLDLQPAPLHENPWLAKLLELVAGLAHLARGRFAVGLPLTRGPWDLVAALRGSGAAYLDLCDRPDEIAALAGRCAALWIAVTRALAAAIPRWRGGYVSFLGVWGRTFDPMPQDDASVSVGAAMYRRVMQAADRRVARAWARPIFHLHSAGLQVLDDVVGLPGRGALNIDVDPSGPPPDALLPRLRQVQDLRVPLHLLVFELDQARYLASALAPAGLAITYQPIDPAAERAGRSAPNA